MSCLSRLPRDSRRNTVSRRSACRVFRQVIDELGKLAGVGDEIAAVTAAAMRGELDFEQSLRQRVGKLAGLPESALQTVAERLPLTEGMETLVRALHRMGYKTAILSGGFTYFARHLQARFGFHHVHANELEIVEGRLTGRVLGEVRPHLPRVW